MKMIFRQKFFSWLCSYDVFDENENIIYSVKGQLSWGHCLNIYDAAGNFIGTVQEKLFRLLPKFEIFLGGKCLGYISKKLSFFSNDYDIDYMGWNVSGGYLGWDYCIYDRNGSTVATVSKELLHLTDTYIIDVSDKSNAVCALMFVIAVDAEKCSKRNN